MAARLVWLVMDRSKYCAATDTGVAPQVRKMSGDSGGSHHGEGDTVLLRFHLCLGMHFHSAESACVFTRDVQRFPKDLASPTRSLPHCTMTVILGSDQCPPCPGNSYGDGNQRYDDAFRTGEFQGEGNGKKGSSLRHGEDSGCTSNDEGHGLTRSGTGQYPQQCSCGAADGQ